MPTIIYDNGVYRALTEEELKSREVEVPVTVTPEDRISALEEIETQQDESIATLFETIMGESEVTA